MRVAIIGDYHRHRAQIHGGVQAAFTYFIDGLRNISDLEVHIISRSLSEFTEYGGPIEQDGIVFHILSSLPRFELARGYRTYQAFLNNTLACLQPDVVHAQDTGADAYVTLRSGYPVVINEHGFRIEDAMYYYNLLKRVRNLLHSLCIERYCMKHTHHLIAISRYVTEYFSSLIRPDTQVYYAPNAIHRHFFDLKDVSFGQTILFAGRVIQCKRQLDLVKALA